MRVETVRAGGDGTWILGLVGTESERFRKVTLSTDDLAGLTKFLSLDSPTREMGISCVWVCKPMPWALPGNLIPISAFNIRCRSSAASA